MRYHLAMDDDEQLAEAERNIAQTKERIREQKERVARLTSKGHNTREAQRLLNALTATLRVFERHRQTILKKLVLKKRAR
jgi:septal ring factor EnvC (AmiA/AmiB activator)